MESNKPLSVHMTHEEYEQYKKFLKLTENPKNKVFAIEKKETFFGRPIWATYKVYSESEISKIVANLLEQKIEVLQKEITELKSRRWYQLW